MLIFVPGQPMIFCVLSFLNISFAKKQYFAHCFSLSYFPVVQLMCGTHFPVFCIFSMTCRRPSAKLDTAQHWPSITKNLPKIGCQYRAVAGMITPVCTWRPMLAQTLAASTCFRHSNGSMLCRTLVFSLPGWFAVIKVTHGPVMCRP